MANESLVFDILARDNASSAFIKAGQTAKDAAGDVQSLVDRLAEVSQKSVDARVGLEGDDEANAQIDSLQAKLIKLGEKTANPNIDVKGALDAQAQIDKVSLSLDKLGAKGEDTTGILDSLAGTGAGVGGAATTGMGALIGAGAVLSPILVTLGTGLGGLGIAAYGLAKPIEAAAQKTGGLQANLKSLDTEQQTVAKGILGLQGRLGTFEQAVQPEVIGVFNKGLQLAGNLLTDIEPVTAAVGKGFEGFIGQIDTAFNSGTWKGFWAFMTQTAEPDMNLLGQDVATLIEDLPLMLRALQPVATGALETLRDVEQLPAALGKVANATSVSPSGSGNILSFLANAGSVGSSALNSFVNYLSTAQGKTDVFAGSLNSMAKDLTGVGSGISQTAPAMTRFGSSATDAETPVKNLTTSSRDLSNNAVAAVKPVSDLATSSRDLSNNATAAVTPTSKTAGAMSDLGNAAGKAAPNLQQVYEQVTNIHDAETKSLNTLTQYNDALIGQYNSAATLNTDLKDSHDKVGLLTTAQRSSFSAADQYISDTITAAKQAGNNSGQIQNVITSLKDELPKLESVQGGTKQYWQEVKTLVGWLHTLEQERAIHEQITVTGKGQWAISGPSGSRGLQNQFPGPRAAQGAFISAGSRSGADDVIAAVSKGELIVPAGMVKAGMVDNLKGKIPGFASGGVVGSYSGNVPGIPGFIGRENKATVSAIASSLASAIKSAMTVSSSTSYPATPGGGAPAANAALARRMYPAWGSGAEWNAWNAVAMAESGWSQYARNPTSGAYGIPQALPPSKMGPAANPPQSNPGAQIAWMISYIRSTYGDPIGAAAHENAYHWYDQGGILPPGKTIAINNTGRPEMVIPPGAAQKITIEIKAGDGGRYSSFLVGEVQKYVMVHGGDVQTALGQRS